MQKPSVGRIVHYVSHGTPVQPDGTQAFTSEPRAAIITAVHNDTCVDLCVLNPTGLFFNTSVLFHDGDAEHADATPEQPVYRGGTWHWPPRV